MISQFDDLIYSAISTVGTPANLSFTDFFALILSVIQKESSFDPNANPDNDHIGLMQVSSSTWGYSANILFDPANNIGIGTQILYDLINKFGLQGGLGAYRLGPLNRFASTAVAYANKVLSFFSSFRNKVMSMLSPTFTGGEYFLPGDGVTSTINVNDVSTWPTLPDTSQQPAVPSFQTSEFAYTQSVGLQADNTWVWIALAAVVVLVVLMD